MPVAITRSGAVRGIEFDGVRAWRGIPYAAPPVGRLRWAPPHREEPWHGVRDAGEFAARAPQSPPEALLPADLGVATDAHTPCSEDCLYLNVCAPQGTGPALPVQVWLHGGGFHYGSGAHPFGDGVGVARRGTVVVTVNYRLGALGLLNLGAVLGPEYAAAANAGVLDQIAALGWVRDNIAAFGGDPDNVTLAGLSAGGKAVANLMTSPAATGLFHRAIMHSGGDHTAEPETTAELARRFVGLLDPPGGDLARIREVPAAEIMAAQYQLASGPSAVWVWRATVDGGVLPQRPIHALAAGAAAGVALIAGTVDNEAGVYVHADPGVDEFADEVAAQAFGERAGAVAAAYAEGHAGLGDAERRRVFLADERYGAPTLRLLDVQSRHAPVWGFRFRAPTEGIPERDWYLHGADVVYASGLAASADPAIEAVSEGMQEALAGFRRTGVPRSPRLPEWPNYRRVDRAVMVFATPSRIAVDAANPLYAPVWADHDWAPGTWWPLRR